MPKYWIRKQGRQHSVYQTLFTDYDQPPEGGEFAITIEAENEAQLQAQIGTKDYVLISPPARGSAEARACADDGHLPQVTPANITSEAFVANAKALGMSQEKIDEITRQRVEMPASGSASSSTPVPTSVGQMMFALVPALAQVNKGSELQDKALLEYRMLVIRNLSDLTKLTLLERFLLKLWPDIYEDLADIKREEQDNG